MSSPQALTAARVARPNRSWRAQMVAELEYAVSQRDDIADLLVTNADNDISAQNSQISDLVASGVDILLVDAVSDILTVNDSEVLPPPDVASDMAKRRRHRLARKCVPHSRRAVMTGSGHEQAVRTETSAVYFSVVS